jgi:hypothetical protein
MAAMSAMQALPSKIECLDRVQMKGAGTTVTARSGVSRPLTRANGATQSSPGGCRLPRVKPHGGASLRLKLWTLPLVALPIESQELLKLDSKFPGDSG